MDTDPRLGYPQPNTTAAQYSSQPPPYPPSPGGHNRRETPRDANVSRAAHSAITNNPTTQINSQAEPGNHAARKYVDSVGGGGELFLEQRLFDLIPKQYRDRNCPTKCQNIMKDLDRETKIDTAKAVELLPEDKRYLFIKNIEPLATATSNRERLKGEIWIRIIALVRFLPEVHWGTAANLLAKAPVEELKKIIAALPVSALFLQRVAPILCHAADTSDWDKILKLDRLPSQFKEDSINLLLRLPEENRGAVAHLLVTDNFVELKYVFELIAHFPSDRAESILHDAVPALRDSTTISDWVNILKIAPLLSHQASTDRAESGKQSQILEGIKLLSSVKKVAQEYSLELFALLHEEQRNIEHLKLCTELFSCEAANQSILIGFRQIRTEERSETLEAFVRASKEHRIKAEWIQACIIKAFGDLPRGEKHAILELVITELPKVNDPIVLLQVIRLFGLLPKDKQDPSHLRICKNLLSAVAAVGDSLGNMDEVIAAISSLPLKEGDDFLQLIEPLQQQEGKIIVNAIKLLVLLPKDQQHSTNREKCVALLKGSHATEGARIIEAVKTLSVFERSTFLERSAEKLYSISESVWLRGDILKLFSLFLGRERNQGALQDCVNILSGTVKYFERDLIIEAIKQLPQEKRAAFVKENTSTLSGIEDMLHRAREVQTSVNKLRALA